MGQIHFIVVSEFWANIHPLIYPTMTSDYERISAVRAPLFPIIPYFPIDKLEDGSVWDFLITWLKTSK